MPNISTIADIVNLTLPTYEYQKYDSAALAQLYPDYEVVKQFFIGAKKTKDLSREIKTVLEIGSPSSYEHTYTNHPAQTSAPELSKFITTPLVKVRTSTTFSEDEEALQGSSKEKIVDAVQMRLTKWRRDYIEGLENDLLSFPAGPSVTPDRLRGILGYWVNYNSAVTDFAMNGGNDPTGHSGGAGGITKAEESRWPNAVGKFANIASDDFFDKIDQFLNRRRLMTVVPHPQVTVDVPREIIYVQEPVKRAVGRFLQGNNEALANDAGLYRDANVYRSIPITIWHALSAPDSPVRPSTATAMLIDWNSFMYQCHSDFDEKITGPTMLPNIPGQMVMYKETWHALHCTRRDRNLILTTDNEDLSPSNS